MNANYLLYRYKDFFRQLKAFLSSFCHLYACEMSQGSGAFDHLNGPLCGAFERHFDPGKGNLNNNFQKVKCPGGCSGGDVEASI